MPPLNVSIGIGIGAFMLLYAPWRIWHDKQPWKEALGVFGIGGVAVILGAYNLTAPNQLFIVIQLGLMLLFFRYVRIYRNRTRDERQKRVDAMMRH